MHKWKQLDSRDIVSDRWLRLTADRCQLHNGAVIDPYYVLHDNDWVQVFATNSGGEVLIVQQYRYAGDVVCLELPGGVVDVDETAADGAKRELLEETGFVSHDWDYVGWMFPNPARQTNRIHMFIARNVRASGAQSLDCSEDIRVQFMSSDAIHSHIVAGDFNHALHIAGFFRCLAHMECAALSATRPG